MAFVVSSVTVCLIFAALNYIWDRHRDRRRLLFYVNLCITVCGVLLLLVSAAVTYSISASGDGNATEWARDMLYVYYGLSLPFTGVLFIIIMLPSFMAWGDKSARTGMKYYLRSVSSVLSSALLLIIGAYYSATVQNTSFPLDRAVYLASFGEAFIFRALYLTEYRSHLLEYRANVKRE